MRGRKKLGYGEQRECVICGDIYLVSQGHRCPDSVLDRIDRIDRAQPLEPTGSALPRSYDDRLEDGWQRLAGLEEEEMERESWE